MKPKLKEADKKLKDNGSREGLFRTVTVGQQKYKGLRISCADTECVFEFKAYKFNPDGYDSGKQKRRAPRRAVPIVEADYSSPSSLATLLNAHPLPQLLQSQSSTDGEEASERPDGCPQPLHIPSTHRGHSVQRDGEEEEDQRVLVLSEEEGVASPHDSNRYGKPPAAETVV